MELKDGDRYMDIGVEQAVITPLHPDTLHNFGPASSRDTVVYTCERPGGETSTGDKLKTIEKVREWKDFMSHPDRNIKHVIILHIPYTSENSFSKIMAVLDEVAGKGERVVAHCTHGMGRSGRIAAGWLVHKYGLTAEEASEEVLATARANGVERMGAPTQLTLWMEKK